MSPWAAACGSIAAWPLHYLSRGAMKAVLGGWDPSARKFFRPYELSFTVPMSMFLSMLERYRESFLMTDTWQTVLGLLVAMTTFNMLNHLIVGVIIWLARGENFKQSGIFDFFIRDQLWRGAVWLGIRQWSRTSDQPRQFSERYRQ